jgi:hypothetical protein
LLRHDVLVLPPPDPSALPSPLNSLDPGLMSRWAIGDDVER